MGQGRALEAGPRAFTDPEGHKEPGKVSFGLRDKLEAREETAREQRGQETGTSSGSGQEEMEKCEGQVPGRVGLDLGRLGLLHSCWLPLTWRLEPQCPPC